MNPINNGKFNLSSMQFIQFNGVVSFSAKLSHSYAQTFTKPFPAAVWMLCGCWENKAIDHVIVMLMLFMCSVYSIEVSIVVQQKQWQNKYTHGKKTEWKERFSTEWNQVLVNSTMIPFTVSPPRKIQSHISNLCWNGMQRNTVCVCVSSFCGVNVCKHIHWK